MDIPSFVWQSMSIKARKEAIQAEQKKIALREATRTKRGKPGSVATPTIVEESEPFPTMPRCDKPQVHREKINSAFYIPDLRMVNSLVARPVNKKEIRSNPKAQEALDLEWNKLVKKKVQLTEGDQAVFWYFCGNSMFQFPKNCVARCVRLSCT